MDDGGAAQGPFSGAAGAGFAGSNTASGPTWAERFNWLVAKEKVEAPLVIGRDHLDSGSVASPNRETEGMKDGSDAIADWPLLNALVNAVNGASWVSIHHGGGVGIGYSIHAGMVCVADGSPRPRSACIAFLDLRPRHRHPPPRRRRLRRSHRHCAGIGTWIFRCCPSEPRCQSALDGDAAAA